ncbi:MAG: hypothetical protein ABFC63_02160 [Thermoguttaceae bacterium]
MICAMLGSGLFADQTAYDSSYAIGQVIGFLLIAIVVLWVIGKVFRR